MTNTNPQVQQLEALARELRVPCKVDKVAAGGYELSFAAFTKRAKTLVRAQAIIRREAELRS